MNRSLYKLQIIDHYKNPRNYHTLSQVTHQHHINNQHCGDELTLYLEIKNEQIYKIAFQGQGCAISIASASIFCEKLKGLKLSQVKNITSQELFDLIGISSTTGRKKCVTLVYQALQNILQELTL